MIAPDGKAARTARKRSKICQNAFLPSKGVRDEAPWIKEVRLQGVSEADNHSAVVDKRKLHCFGAVRAAEGSQVDEFIAEGMGALRCRLCLCIAPNAGDHG